MIVPALLVLTLAVALSGAAFLVLWLDRYKAEPVLRLALVAVWGIACALIFRFTGPPTVFVVGFDALLGTGSAPPVAAGLLEVLPLALGLALVAASRYLDGPLDGAVFGTVAGLGFAAAQSLAALRSGWVPASPLVPLFITLVRAAATAAVGSSIGFAKLAFRMWVRAPFALAAVLAAGLLRWLIVAAASWGWDAWGAGGAAFNLALVAAGLLLLAAVYQGALLLESRVITRQLADEVELGVLPAWVAEVLPSYWRRVRSDWWRRRDERREIVRLLTSLAFRKQRLRNLSELRANLYGLEVGRLRQRARTLLALPRDANPATASGP